MAVMLVQVLMLWAYPEFVERNRFLASIFLVLRSKISWLLSWTSNLWSRAAAMAERSLCGLESHFQARPSSLGCW